MSETYTATARRCEGWWALEVEEPESGRILATQARRLDQAPAMVADLLATFFDRGREEFAVQVVPLLDDDVRAEIEDARTKRIRIEEVIREAGESSRKAARHLHTQGLTARDIAVLLGVTHQRVSQLLAS